MRGYEVKKTTYKKRELFTYERILYSLSIFNYLTLSSLLVIGINPKATYKIIDKLKNDGLIKPYIAKATYKYVGKDKKGKNKYIYYDLKTTAYSITLKGLQHLNRLKEHTLSTETEWMRDIQLPNREPRVMGPTFKDPETIMRFIQISDASQFAHLCGLSVSPIFTDQEIFESIDPEDKTTHLHSIIMPALENKIEHKQKYNGTTVLNAEAEIVYTNVLEMKRAVTAGNIEEKITTRNEVQRASMSGVIDAPLKSAIVYVGNKKGMSWRGWVVRKDIQLFLAYMKFFGVHKKYKIGNYVGVLLFDTKKMLHDLYFDTKKRNLPGEQIGNRYESFVCFPMNRDGMDNMIEFLNNDTDEYEDTIIKKAIADGYFEANTQGEGKLFPLLYKETNDKIAIGFFIDIKKCKSIERTIKSYARNHEIDELDQGKLPYVIMCYDWQVEYYQTILPIRCMTI